MPAAPGSPRGSAPSPRTAYRGVAREAFRRGVEQRGMLLVVEGHAGAGKTFLLRDLVRAAVADGQRSAFVRADEIERTEPFSLVERLVAAARIPGWHLQPEPQDDPFAIGRECAHHLVGGAEPSLRLLVVDDAQWIDPRSQRVLRYLIPRVTRSGVILAFGVRTPYETGGFGELLATAASEDPLDEVHVLEPLTADDIAALVRERHGVEVSAQVADRILAETGGSFLAVDTLIEALTDREVAGLPLDADLPFTAIADGQDPLVHRFASLDAPTRRTCEIVCLAGHELTPEVLGGASKALDQPVRLDDAVEAGVLVVTGTGSTVMPRHELVARAIADTVDAERTRAIHRALAEATVGGVSLRHSLRGHRELDPALLARVDAAVEEWTATGSLEAASEVLRDALEVASDAGTRSRLLVDLALVHVQGRSCAEAIDLLDEIERLPPSITRELVAIAIGAHLPGAAVPIDRARALLAASASSPDDVAVQAFLACTLVLLSMRSESPDVVTRLVAQAKALVARAPAAASALSRSRLAFMVTPEAHLLVLDCALMVLDQRAADMDAVRRALPGLVERIRRLPDQPLVLDALIAVAEAAIASGDLAAGRALAREGVDLLDRVGEPWSAGALRLILAECLVLDGEYASAADVLGRAERRLPVALDGRARAETAALRACIATVTRSDGGGPGRHALRVQPAPEVATDRALVAACEAARAVGDAESVLAITADPPSERRARGRHGHLTYRAHALLDTGRIVEAAALVDRLAHWRGSRWQEHWGSIAWLRARLAHARGDLDGARWHFDVALEHAVPTVPRALTLVDRGRLLAEVGEPDPARASIRAGLGILERVGASAYVARMRPLLADGPASSPSAPSGRVASLTARELQIAQQLADGRSNSQIAESLVVSITTVRSHVSNVLRKLQLGSRGEVARALRGETPG